MAKGRGRQPPPNGNGNGRDHDDNETWEDPSDIWSEFLEPVSRMSRDMRQAAALLGPDEARHLVDSYYTMQEGRKRAGGQRRALAKSGEPHSIISWLFAQSGTLEKQIKSALDVYTHHHMMGSWMRQIYGIGPVLSAGLLAHIDIERAPTVGHIWSFAGWAGDDQKKWNKGSRRPFNAKFKVLCWKVGQSFMKFHNAEECFYGHYYRDYKIKKIAQNEGGGYSRRAAEIVRDASPKYKLTDSYRLYNLNGKLSPGHIDSLARRAAVKLFLAHLHGEWYTRFHGSPPPLPYPIAHLNHAHVIQSPVPPRQPQPPAQPEFYK
jgi:hypothetical protein